MLGVCAARVPPTGPVDGFTSSFGVRGTPARARAWPRREGFTRGRRVGFPRGRSLTVSSGAGDKVDALVEFNRGLSKPRTPLPYPWRKPGPLPLVLSVWVAASIHRCVPGPGDRPISRRTHLGMDPGFRQEFGFGGRRQWLMYRKFDASSGQAAGNAFAKPNFQLPSVPRLV